MKSSFKKLFVWQKADALALKIYQFSKDFPKTEMYGITSQLRRSGLSIPTNLAEAAGRQNPKETKQFVNIALGSITEVEYLLEFSYKLGYLKDKEYQEINELRNDTGALLWLFYQSLK